MSAAEKSVVEMFQRAFNSNAEKINLLAVNVMCTLISEDPTLIGKIIELLLEKIRSDDAVQSLKGLEILGECMAKCGEEFQRKIAEYRFLNKLIKLVSKRYFGKNTPSEVRSKIMYYLLLWVEEYPDKTKIKDAYDRLSKEGIEHKSISAPSRKCFLDPEIDEKIKALLKSGNREDAKRANLLIQYYVEQDEKRNELLMQQKQELKEAESTINLFNEMINRYLDDTQSTDAKEALEDLYGHCLNLCPIIRRIPEIVDSKEEETVAESLRINDELTEVIAKYESLSIHDDAKGTTDENCDLLPNITDVELENVEKIDNDGKTENVERKDENIDVLKDIFFNSTPGAENLIPLMPLKPIAVQEKKDNNEQTVNFEETSVKPNESKHEFLSFIHECTESLFKENLRDNIRIGKFEKKQDKVTLSEMKRNKSDENLDICKNDTKLKPKSENNSPDIDQDSKVESTITQNSGALDFHDIEHILSNFNVKAEIIKNTSDFNEKIKISKPEMYTSEDEELIGSDSVEPLDKGISDTVSEDAIQISDNSQKNLIDISLDASIKGSNKLPKVNVMNDVQGLMIKFGFAEYRPSDDVFVIIISIINQGSIPIKNFHLEAGVPKPCKLRLLSPSRTHLDGVDDPLQLPSENIKQILLLYNPTKSPVDITFIVSYNLSDDVDPIKEPVVATNVPYLSV